jgi:hypothetical protein
MKGSIRVEQRQAMHLLVVIVIAEAADWIFTFLLALLQFSSNDETMNILSI